MKKTSYASLKLKTNTETKIFTHSVGENEIEIEVLQYLPAEIKNAIVNGILSIENIDGIRNPIVVEMAIGLQIVYNYSSINFTEKQLEQEIKIYNELKSNGIISAIMAQIPEDELGEMFGMIYEALNKQDEYNKSISGLIQNLVSSLPAKAEELNKIIENIDQKKLEAIISKLSKNIK